MPPLVPAMAMPTFVLLPLTVATVSVSLSGSVSFVSTLPVAFAFSVVDPASATAVGAGLVTVHVKLRVVVAPCGSVAVTLTENGPLTEALLAIVPLMMPFVGLIDRPAGKPLAENVSVSVASGSEKFRTH